MKSDNDTASAPERNTSAAAHNKATKRHHGRQSLLRFVMEIASVMVVLGVALYFILGASAKGPAPVSSSPLASTSLSPTPTNSQAGNLPANLPKLHILSVTPDNSTAKISFKPFPGAKDYRVFDVSEPKVVKYAGMAHLAGGPFLMNPDGTPVFPFQRGGNGPEVLNIPYPQIEWNLLEDGQPHTLVVQAVNQLGPIPPGNLYNNNNSPQTPNNQTVSTLGMNEGITPDGHDSTNGQGPSTNNPKPIAQSILFIAQANSNYRTIPSTSSASQTFFDTFADSEADQFKRAAYNPAADTATYTLNAGTDKAWTIYYNGADVRDSYPFISAGHFMDVLFDGGTPGTGNPLHTSYGSMSMSPNQTVDLSAGKVLHVTMEVDLHESGRRWIGIELAPANDPLTAFDPNSDPLNQSDKALFLDYFPGDCALNIFTGPSAGAGSPPKWLPLWGALGQANSTCDTSNLYWGGGGINLVNRGKLDLFVTQTHAALFINGQLIIESTIPGGLPFTQARVNFTHYVYHTANDVNELQQYRPWETFWLDYYRFSDERHWDNMGFEVFPAAAASTSAQWQKLVAMPHAVSPQLVFSGAGSNENTAVTNPSGSVVVVDVPSSSIR